MVGASKPPKSLLSMSNPPPANSHKPRPLSPPPERGRGWRGRGGGTWDWVRPPGLASGKGGRLIAIGRRERARARWAPSHFNDNHHLDYPGGIGRVSDVALARVAQQLGASPAPFAIGFGAGKQPDGR